MAIVFTCPRCDRKYSVADTMAGRRVTCKGCGQEFPVPGTATAAESTRPSSWDEDDGRPIAFARPGAGPPAHADRPPRAASDDEEFRPPPRVKVRSSGSRSSGSAAGGWSMQGPARYGATGGGLLVLVCVAIFAARSFFGLGGGTPRAHEAAQMMGDYAAILNEMSGLIEQMHDPASVQNLGPQMTSLQSRNQVIMSRIQTFGGLTAVEDRWLKREVGPTMRAALTRTKNATRKFETVPGYMGQLALMNAELDREIAQWGGPSGDVASSPSQAFPAPSLPVATAPSAATKTPEVVIPPNADDVTRSLLELKSANVTKISDALKRLEKLPPDQRADEVVKAALPFLSPQHTYAYLASDAVKVLAAWPTPEGVAVLCRSVSDENILVRNESMAGLGQIKAPGGIEPIIDRLVIDQYNATNALVAYGTALAEAPLIARLTHADYRVRANVCGVLAKVGGKDTLLAMKDLPPDEHPYTRIQAQLAWEAIAKRVGPLPGTATPKPPGVPRGKMKG